MPLPFRIERLLPLYAVDTRLRTMNEKRSSSLKKEVSIIKLTSLYESTYARALAYVCTASTDVTVVRCKLAQQFLIKLS